LPYSKMLKSLKFPQVAALQEYLAHKKTRPPLDHRRALGTVLLWVPRRARVLVSKVPLCMKSVQGLRVGVQD
jgi:hypothetical protein